VVNRYVYRDSPRVSQTLTSDSTLACLQEIVRQMREQGQTVLRCTVTVPSCTRLTGVGDLCVVASSVRPGDGVPLENALAETLTALVTNDSFTGGATEFQEPVRVTGAGAQGDVFAFDWPQGSGASLSLTCADGAEDASGGNLLTNSGFDAWTDGEPDGWDIDTGVAGTDFAEDTGVITRPGGSSLKLIGTASTVLQRLRREVTGLTGLTQYGVAVWLQSGGLGLTDGTLRLGLSQSDGTFLSDAAGNPCYVEIDMTEVGAAFEPFGGALRTPRDMPDEVYFDVMVSEDMAAGEFCFTDLISLTAMRQMYTGGCYFSAHSGGTAPAVNDQVRFTVTNSRGTAGTLSNWQTLWLRLFPDAAASELLLPSSATPTIEEAWIA
jgi:hypothetical protein